jgi:succinyl-CoA:acetate CoA-transferase
MMNGMGGSGDFENCVAEPYRTMLRAYVNEARQRGGHTPHVLEKAFAWHERYRKTGSMLASENLTV